MRAYTHIYTQRRGPPEGHGWSKLERRREERGRGRKGKKERIGGKATSKNHSKLLENL